MPSVKQQLVSVIVPIYNAQKYLDQCLASIRAQDYGCLEILCINDGSTDDSLSIIEAHASVDPRIRVIEKENGGYGAACNRGISESHGDWIAIVEPDDWIERGMLGDMLAFAGTFDSSIDIIKTPWWNINDWDRPESEQSRTLCPLGPRVRRSSTPFTLSGHPELIEFHPGIWSALYNREFLEHFDIRFPEYPGAGWADNPFLIDTLCQARSIVYLDKPYYCYRADLPGSTRNHATESAIRLPFERWRAMLDRIKELGICDRGILESHYLRGFLYTDGAIYDDGWDNPIVQEGIHSVFSIMDEGIVLDSIKVSPRRKRLFCSVCGLKCRGINVACCLHAISEKLINVRTLGIQGAFRRICFKLTGKR